MLHSHDHGMNYIIKNLAIFFYFSPDKIGFPEAEVTRYVAWMVNEKSS
jgi:hypothetical protein